MNDGVIEQILMGMALGAPDGAAALDSLLNRQWFYLIIKRLVWLFIHTDNHVKRMKFPMPTKPQISLPQNLKKVLEI